MHLRHSITVGLLVLAGSASAQQMAPAALHRADALESSASAPGWTFGPVAPHLKDAGKRTVYGLAFGAAFMGFGLGIDLLNHAQCRGQVACFGGNPVQAGIGFAFLGTLLGTTGPTLHTKCTRSGRALLGMFGAAIGGTAAGAIVGERMFNARTGDPATFRTMGSGLLGMSLGAGILTAIC